MPNDRYLLCPQREASEPALITQTIPLPLCELRQREGYHKCPRCLNRTIGAASAPAAGELLATGSARRP